jgi:diguanylate cyclase (GGDEF)-like protein
VSVVRRFVRSSVLPWAVRVVGVGLVGLLLTSATASYVVRTVTALAAAGVLLVGAHRHRDGLGTARRLFAGALLMGAVSGLASAAYAVATGEPSPTGWLADWLYLSYSPLAVCGVLALPRARRGGTGALRALADGAVVAGSLWYLTMSLVVTPLGLGDDLPTVARLATLAYPVVPVFVVAVTLSAVPRVARRARPFLLRSAAGLTLLGAGDIAFSVAAWGGWYEPTSWVAAVNQLGILLILDAALVGSAPVAALDEVDEGAAAMRPAGPLAQATSYVPLGLAVAVALAELVQGDGLSGSELWPVLLVIAAVVVRHLTGTKETAGLLARLAQREQQAQAMARTDPLTGLANRTAFVERLDAALRDPACHPVAVALLDLNDFKDINDTHGHDTGDEVLRQVAARLSVAVPVGLVARLGGDEFAVFVPSSSDGGQRLGAVAASAFAEPVRIGSRPFAVRPSVGVVVDERPSGASRAGDATHLLAHADVAMYEAKGSKRVRFAPVTVLTGAARASAAATIMIRDEIGNPDLTQFRVVYQPVVDLVSGEIRAAEALLRWRHPQFGEISPSTFIPLAERVGSVAMLGDHVIETSLDDLAGWVESSGAEITVGVNVSPRQLTDPGLAAALSAQLAVRGLHPNRLGLEVTEEALVDDMDTVAETVAALRAVGVNVAVDDFGTGYSSLRYLRRFDANIVKIDQEFVQAAPDEPRTDALVGSVVTMAAALGMICVAEGIETLEQLALVRGHGCHFGQGYLLARPMPAEQLEALLVARHVYPVDVAVPALPAPRDTSVVPLRRVT